MSIYPYIYIYIYACMFVSFTNLFMKLFISITTSKSISKSKSKSFSISFFFVHMHIYIYIDIYRGWFVCLFYAVCVYALVSRASHYSRITDTMRKPLVFNIPGPRFGKLHGRN